MNSSRHYERVLSFMQAIGYSMPKRPITPEYNVRLLHANLIFEEANECIQALGFRLLGSCHGQIEIKKSRKAPVGLAILAKELCDLSFVTIGTMIAYGLPEFLVEVDENNMTKIGGPKNDLGKQLKPKDYKKLDLTRKLAEMFPTA